MAASALRPAHHIVGVYRTDDFLAGRVASFITEGLTSGEQVIVLASTSHWAAISTRLTETGLAFHRAVTEGRLLLLDAGDVLDGLTVDGRVGVDGMPDTALVNDAMIRLIELSDSGERVTLH